MKKSKRREPRTGRPPKFRTAAKNLSVYLPEDAIRALRQFAAHEYATTGVSRHASDIIVDALREHAPFRDFVENLWSGAGPKTVKRSALTFDEIWGLRISELELKKGK